MVGSGRDMRGPSPRAAYAFSVFLSALLLFDVQFILSKHLLPWFGGAAAVWTTCMLFFQVFLLLGYLYAHLLAGWPPSRQRNVHLLLLGLALVLLLARAAVWPSALTPGDEWKPASDAWPVARILRLLGAAVGLPYLALASTGPLLQSWYARLFPEESPYRLYALSNLGSLLGLVGYPLVAEPLLHVSEQASLWTIGFCFFAAATGACAWAFAESRPAPLPATPDSEGDGPGPGLLALWFGLAAMPSVMLLAVTSQLCQEIAVIPLLWMLPLALYLLSFVLCFEYGRFYRREAILAVLVVAAAGGTLALYRGTNVRATGQISIFLGVLFAYALGGHGELARLKPSPRHLTTFYLVVAAGGAAGGVFAALVAPRIFPAFFELHMALLAGPVLLLLAVLRDENSWLNRGPGRLVWALRVSVVAWALALAVALGIHVEDSFRGAERISRNFYGVLRVLHRDEGTAVEMRQLKHGRIIHGLQYAHPDRRGDPTSYYGPRTGIGLALERHPRRVADEPLRVGVVGLGVGTLAAYARAGDTFRFYEINPAVIALAQGPTAVFTYLSDARGKVEVVPGDARLALEREAPEEFDVLAVDAFSSDSIPVHLLTREALGVYLRHLRMPDGIVAFHVSNRFLDLRPVVKGLAGERGLRAALVAWSGQDGAWPLADPLDWPSTLLSTWPSDWILVTRESRLLDDPQVAGAAVTMNVSEPGLPVWTDGYSNLLRVIKR